MFLDLGFQETLFKFTMFFQLHFSSGISGDAKVTESAQDLLKELEDLESSIRQDTVQLETAIAQVDQYQLEVQQLRQQMVQVEQQLRSTMAPVHLADDREQALKEQQVGRFCGITRGVTPEYAWRHDLSVMSNLIF